MVSFFRAGEALVSGVMQVVVSPTVGIFFSFMVGLGFYFWSLCWFIFCFVQN